MMTKTQMTLIALGLSLYSFSQHTFSIVAVDPNTGDIGSAGAVLAGLIYRYLSPEKGD
jgi:hypothetical protein